MEKERSASVRPLSVYQHQIPNKHTSVTDVVAMDILLETAVQCNVQTAINLFTQIYNVGGTLAGRLNRQEEAAGTKILGPHCRHFMQSHNTF